MRWRRSRARLSKKLKTTIFATAWPLAYAVFLPRKTHFSGTSDLDKTPSPAGNILMYLITSAFNSD
jgi:hypothetical protein